MREVYRGVVIEGLALFVVLVTMGMTTLRVQDNTRGIAFNQQGAQPIAYTQGNRYGINTFFDREVNPQRIDQGFQQIHAAGIGYARQNFLWDQIELPKKGQYWDTKYHKSSWDKWDTIVYYAQKNDVQVVARLGFTPRWARPSWSYGDVAGPTVIPSDLNDFGDFVYTIVSRYKGRIRYYQIWNEPNNRADWGHQPIDAKAYTRMLKIAYLRAKQADPAVVIISAALSPTSTNDTYDQNDLLYLQKMYDDGAKPYFDILGVQAYGLFFPPTDRRRLSLQKRDTFPFRSIEAAVNFSRPVLIREVMVRNGDSAKPMWAGEYGWNAVPQPWHGKIPEQGSVSEDVQAQWTVEANLRAHQEWPYMGVMFLWFYRWPDLPDKRDPTPYFAIVGQNFTPKPVYLALQQLASQRLADLGYHGGADEAVIYQGDWIQHSTLDHTSGWASTIEPGAAVDATFAGDSIRLMVATAPDAALIRVTIDRNTTQTIDLAAPQPGSRQVELPAGPYGLHHLHLQILPRAAGPTRTIGGNRLVLNGFAVLRHYQATPYWLAMTIGAVGALVIGGRWLMLLRRLPWMQWWLAFRGYLIWLRARWRKTRAALLASADPLTTRYLALPETRRYQVYFGVLILTLAFYYYIPIWPIALLGLVGFIILAFLKMEYALVSVPATLPFWELPKHLGQLQFSLTEALILCALLAAFLRSLDHWEQTGQAPWQSLKPGEWIRRGLRQYAPALVLVLAGIVSLGASTYLKVSFRQLREVIIEPVLYYILIITQIKSREGILWQLRGLLLAGILISLGGLAQRSGLMSGLVAAEGVKRVRSFYGSPDNLGLFLGRVVPIAAAFLLFRVESRNWRRFTIVAMILTSLVLGLTFSRGAWFGVVIALLVVVAGRNRKLVGSGVAVAALGLLALYFVKVPRISSLFELHSGSTNYLRLVLWEGTVKMLYSHPLLGVGLDNFLYLYPKYRLATGWQEDPSHPHNILLHYWISLGILGVVVLVWTQLAFFRRVQKVRTLLRGTIWRAVVIGLAASMVDFLAHGLVDNSYFLVDLAVVFWLTYGIIELLATKGVEFLKEEARPVARGESPKIDAGMEERVSRKYSSHST